MTEPKRSETTLLNALVTSLFGRVPPEQTDFENRMRELAPETQKLVERVYDLLGPAAKDAFEEMIVSVADEFFELGRDELG